jgi:hypothetical protein
VVFSVFLDRVNLQAVLVLTGITRYDVVVSKYVPVLLVVELDIADAPAGASFPLEPVGCDVVG